jgi:hypothetical protein
VNSYEGDRGDDSQHGGQHDDDEPRGAIRRLWGGLSDPHGVDESVRDEEKELHYFSDEELKR